MKYECFEFDKKMDFAKDSSVIRLDIGNESGIKYNLSGGFLVAEKDQTEVRADNYIVVAKDNRDKGPSGFSHIICNYDDGDYKVLSNQDTDKKYYTYLPNTNLCSKVNDKKIKCRSVDNAGNKSEIENITLKISLQGDLSQCS